jgi:hypothetical protein
MFRLADRHGFGCHSPLHQKTCAELLERLRSQSRFVFKLRDIDGPLPHNKEIRVQNGGLLGLQKLQGGPALDHVPDVSALTRDILQVYGSLDKLPFDQLIQSVTAYQARPRRRDKTKSGGKSE